MKDTFRLVPLLTLLASVTLAGCGDGGDDYLTGTWKLQGGIRTPYLTFTDTGTVTLEIERGGELVRRHTRPAKISEVDGVFRVRMEAAKDGPGFYFLIEPQSNGSANGAFRSAATETLDEWPSSVAAAPENWTKRKLIKQ